MSKSISKFDSYIEQARNKKPSDKPSNSDAVKVTLESVIGVLIESAKNGIDPSQK
jgi:hypothetical protein